MMRIASPGPREARVKTTCQIKRIYYNYKRLDYCLVHITFCYVGGGGRGGEEAIIKGGYYKRKGTVRGRH